jgi:YaiO family outer membrane protein
LTPLRVLTLLAFCACLVSAAEDALTQARALTKSKQPAAAIGLLQSHLKEEPGDTDARIYLGLVLSWEGRYEEARLHLETVLSSSPGNGDALQALANLELWSDNAGRADRLSAEALEIHPDNVDLLYTRARALRALKREPEALKVLNQLLRIEPAHKAALSTRDGIREAGRLWQVQTSQTYEWFHGDIDPWRESQLALGRSTGAGKVTARFSRADRFGLHSNQSEIEFYPSIRSGTYGYVNVGYSYDATLFPKYRVGADLFQSLGHGFEGSGGIRRLNFTASKVNVYTASLGKYLGNWFYNARTYLTPGAEGASHSVHISARRYFGDLGDYLGFRYGWGSSPVETRTLGDTEILSSSSFYLDIQKSLGRRWSFSFRAGHGREDRLNRGPLRRSVADSNLYFRF